jgi:O-antigen/teichoic acid export membrane protein
VFSPEDYGVWAFVTTSVWLLNAFLIVGMDSAYTRYFFDDGADRRLLTTTSVAFVAAWSTLVVAVLLPFTPQLSEWAFDTDEHADLFAIALATAPLVLVSAIAGAALRNMFRPWLYSAFNVGVTLGGVALGLFLVLGLDRGVEGPLLGVLVATAVVLPLRLWAIRALFRRAFSWERLRALLAFGLPLVPMTLALWVMLVSDRIVIAKFSTTEQLGLYTVAVGAVSVLALADAAFTQAWLPRALQAYDRDPRAASAFYARVLVYIVVAFGLAAVVLSAFADELIGLLTGDDFHGAAVAVGPLSLAAVALASSQVLSMGIRISKRTMYSTLAAALAAALNLALNLVFVPDHGMIAAAWSTAVAYGFLAVSQYVVSQRLVHIDFDLRRALGTAAVVVALVLAVRLVDGVGGVAEAALKLGICLAYLPLLAAFRVVGSRELHALGTLRGGGLRRRAASALDPAPAAGPGTSGPTAPD